MQASHYAPSKVKDKRLLKFQHPHLANSKKRQSIKSQFLQKFKLDRQARFEKSRQKSDSLENEQEVCVPQS